MSHPILVGRSSSHFTRIARLFAIELGVAHTFRPVFDLKSLDVGEYSGNPALKIPVYIDEKGPLFGTENICREIVRRSGKESFVVLRGDVADRVVANAEELTLNVLTTEVTYVTLRLNEQPPLPKLMPSIEKSLDYLEQNLDAALAALPEHRALSFLEVALFCVLEHLPFREVLDITPWKRLDEFRLRFGERESAKATVYRFDTA